MMWGNFNMTLFLVKLSTIFKEKSFSCRRVEVHSWEPANFQHKILDGKTILNIHHFPFYRVQT